MKVLSMFLVLIIVMSECRRAELPLTEQEKVMKVNFSKDCQCEVSLSHSFDAVMNNKNNGSFTVVFKFNSTDKLDFCNKSENWLRHYTQTKIKQLLSVLSHKRNYRNIVVGYRLYKKVPEINESICAKTLVYDLYSAKMTYDIIR